MGVFDKIKNFVPEGLSDVVDVVGSSIAKKSAPACTPAPAPANNSLTKQPASTWSPELENMVTLAIEDGELNDREVQLLVARAQREGIDPDEFEFTLRLRIRQNAKEVERLKNQNPVVALSQAFAMLEQYAKGGEKVVNGTALSAALALIPGVGQVAAVGSLLAAFIETPSNINSLKAEAIRRFVLPDNPEHLNQFISYAASQIQEAEQQRMATFMSVKGMLSSIAVGTDIDIVPIWEHKIDDACDMACMRFPADMELANAVKKYRPNLINKLRAGRISNHQLSDIAAPKDDEELLEVVEFLYNKKSNEFEWEEAKPVHSRMYKEAERRFSSNKAMMDRLSRYKIKKFGIF